MRRLFCALLSLILLAAFNPFVVASQGYSDVFYPLAVGNAWIYSVHEKGKRVTQITWTVTKRDATKDGVEFQIWPSPMQSDDEALTLIASGDQVKESGSGTLLVKGGLRVGESWEMKINGKVVRRLKVVESGVACEGARFKSSDCVTIADTDDRIHLRTVTRYAKGIGPVRFEYYDTSSPSASTPDSVVEMVNYRRK